MKQMRLSMKYKLDLASTDPLIFSNYLYGVMKVSEKELIIHSMQYE